MHHTHLELDPVRDATLHAAIDAHSAGCANTTATPAPRGRSCRSTPSSPRTRVGPAPSGCPRSVCSSTTTPSCGAGTPTASAKPTTPSRRRSTRCAARAAMPTSCRSCYTAPVKSSTSATPDAPPTDFIRVPRQSQPRNSPPPLCVAADDVDRSRSHCCCTALARRDLPAPQPAFGGTGVTQAVVRHPGRDRTALPARDAPRSQCFQPASRGWLLRPSIGEDLNHSGHNR